MKKIVNSLLIALIFGAVSDNCFALKRKHDEGFKVLTKQDLQQMRLAEKQESKKSIPTSGTPASPSMDELVNDQEAWTQAHEAQNKVTIWNPQWANAPTTGIFQGKVAPKKSTQGLTCKRCGTLCPYPDAKADPEITLFDDKMSTEARQDAQPLTVQKIREFLKLRKIDPEKWTCDDDNYGSWRWVHPTTGPCFTGKKVDEKLAQKSVNKLVIDVPQDQCFVCKKWVSLFGKTMEEVRKMSPKDIICDDCKTSQSDGAVEPANKKQKV